MIPIANAPAEPDDWEARLAARVAATVARKEARRAFRDHLVAARHAALRQRHQTKEANRPASA